jgi:hypothetical protein
VKLLTFTPYSLGRNPANAPIVRPRLSDVVPLTGKKLAARARKLSTLRPESFWGSTARKLTEREPTYKARLWALTSHLFTRQSPCTLNVPATWKDTGDYIKQFDQLNNLAERIHAPKPVLHDVQRRHARPGQRAARKLADRQIRQQDMEARRARLCG